MKNKLIIIGFVVLIIINIAVVVLLIPAPPVPPEPTQDELIIERLEEYALERGLCVLYMDNDEVTRLRPPSAAGYEVLGFYFRGEEKEYIVISNKYRHDPYVLAHEIGHHLGWSYQKDMTEETADMIGQILLDFLK